MPIEKAEIGLAASLEEPATERAAPDPDSPFRILVLGDFSGRSSRGVRDPGSLGADRVPIRVDRDNLEEIMSELAVALALRPGGDAGPVISLRPREIDDFHPDQIFERTAAFSGLRRLREDLDDPAAFAEAAAEIRSWSPADPAPSSPAAPESPQTGEDLVSEMLASAERREEKPSREADLDNLLRRVVQPHLAPGPDAGKQELAASVEAAAASWMRNLLHHPDFQAVEAAWRSVDFLVRRLETDGQLQIFVLDVSKEELAQDLRSAGNLAASATCRLLVEDAADSEGWSALAGLYTFDQTLEDVALLGRLAKIARAAGAPFLAAASPHIAGCESLAATPDPDAWRPSQSRDGELWGVLRGLPEASYLGLALPRFLLRLPYGRRTDPVEQFEFEELGEQPRHEDFLWGNPAIACVCLLGFEFTEYAWHMRPEAGRELPGLPLYTYGEVGRKRNLPCAEALLTERAAQALLEEGVMPLLSRKDGDSIRLVRFQSIASPPAPLSGRWR